MSKAGGALCDEPQPKRLKTTAYNKSWNTAVDRFRPKKDWKPAGRKEIFNARILLLEEEWMNNSKLKTQTLNEYVASNLKMPDTDKLPAMEYTTSIVFRHPSDAADAIKAARVCFIP